MAESAEPPPDPLAVVRSRAYLKLLVLCGLTGFGISIAAWCFLSLVPAVQDAVYLDLPDLLGFDTAPWWWPVPVLVAAGALTAAAIVRLPGHGGGIPADGLSGGPVEPLDLPGILLAALATLGLGLVLGPSSPVIALGVGLGSLVVRRAQKDPPAQVEHLVAGSGAFASLAMVFSNPLVAAIILVEATGLGGATAAVLLLPGLMAAGIGSLVYEGLGQLSGLSTQAYALHPVAIDPLDELTLAQFGWSVVLAIAASGVGVAVVEGGRRLASQLEGRKLWVWLPVVGAAVALLAVGFSAATGTSEFAILFSGSRALSPIVSDAATMSVGTLALLFAVKAVAWSISMGSFRGGPVFPAIFLGTAGGLLAAHLPGLPEGAAVPVVVAATVTAVLRLPLSSAVIAFVITSAAGPKALPLLVLAMVISFVLTNWLSAPREPSPRALDEPL